ncbi:MAG: Wzt carbohydrate-binding domain-containing protein [Chloroflexota bacterium]|nr:Wzt carbohydrate-binding domain-containing protein [Chloroflexota bacterium]MDQ5864168.1 Wzt carbohydrate-binding domain-containing protein [Chloroflexota bacterium]
MPPQTEASEADEAAPPVTERADVKITGITFLDGHGVSSQVFRTNEPLTIRLHFDARDRVEDPIFGVAIYTEGGTHVNGPNTRFAGLPIPAIEGTGHVDYHIERLPLLAGRYFVTVAVTGSEMTDMLDHQFHAGSFVVQPTPHIAERMGLVLIPAQWSFHPDSEG